MSDLYDWFKISANRSWIQRQLLSITDLSKIVILGLTCPTSNVEILKLITFGTCVGLGVSKLKSLIFFYLP